jgi:hypothetical protein
VLPRGPEKKCSSHRHAPEPRISAGREGTALILGGGPSLRLRHVSHETSEAAESRRLPGNEIDAEFCRRGTVPRKLLLRIQELNRLPRTGPRRTTLTILAGPRNEGTRVGPAKGAVHSCPSTTTVQALRTQPGIKTIASLKLLLGLPHWPGKALKPPKMAHSNLWINRRRGGAALHSSLNISYEKILDVTAV